jgi:hypothetical protein
VLLVSDGMDAVALCSPVEISGDSLGNMEGLSILDIDRLEGLCGSVDGTEQSLEIEIGAVSERIGLDIMGDPAVGALSDLRNNVGIDWVLDGLGYSENCANNN